GNISTFGTLTPAVHAAFEAASDAEAQQEPVAWGEFYGGKIVSVSLHKSHHYTVPLYTRPSEQAVTEAMELARAVLAQSITAGFNTPGPTPEDVEKAFWALDDAIKAAMEAQDE